MGFAYKQRYFALKTRINRLMWDEETGFYYDIDAQERRLKVRTLAAYWTMLAEIPNEECAASLIAKLDDKEWFGTPHPFPSLAAGEKSYSADGHAYCGSVFPHLNYMVIKALERYQRWDLARDYAIRHIYFVLDSMLDENSYESRSTGDLWEAYLPCREGAALWPDDAPQDERGIGEGPRRRYMTYAALSTVSLMMENVIGLNVSLARKTVDWVVPNFEVMGIENLSLKKNLITIMAAKAARGWEIHLKSDKLYYFTINMPGVKKKTLPIPSGECSMLIDKI